MESVADAAGLDRFPILVLSQGCAVAIQHPERVSHLILYGGFAAGVYKSPNVTPAAREQFDAMKTLMKFGWGANEPTFRQLFTASMIPTATKERLQRDPARQRVGGMRRQISGNCYQLRRPRPAATDQGARPRHACPR